MKLFRSLIRWSFILSLLGLIAGVGAAVAAWLYVEPDLPAVETLRDVRFQVPLKVYSEEGGLIAEFGEKRRIPVRFSDIPERQIQAFLAAEDDRFFQHPGVDYHGLLRAVYELVTTGHPRSGGSTITMQVARNFFLTREKKFIRKLREIFLAIKIEQELTKQEILELYLNKIYLGQRSYGIGAAAQIYYGRDVGELTLAQMASIAGLPKAPARDNPVTNPTRSKERRGYVLRRMLELGYIDKAAYDEAVAAPVTASIHTTGIDVEAPYIAEMVRQAMVERFGEEEAYTSGFKVYTTLRKGLQPATVAALRGALLEYDRRHGWRGPLDHIDNAPNLSEEEWRRQLERQGSVGHLRTALVTRVEGQEARFYLENGETGTLAWAGVEWAAKKINVNAIGPKPKLAEDVLKVGDLVRVERHGEEWWLAQVPEVEGALVALDPTDGAILALTGGFDFYHSKFNRVTQAKRQPGSNFKPFIYSAALEKGFTAATLVNDAPVVFEDVSLESAWRPENYSGKIFGPTRLREALTHSRNLVSIRVLDAIGIPFALDYVERFGFDRRELPANLSLALGSGELTPLQVVKGYAVFANGGFRVEPYFIRRIEDSFGTPLEESAPLRVCAECSDEELADPERHLAPRVITPQNRYLMTTILRDVIKHGTGRRALTLGRGDLAGKTGTTNDQRDAWFSGFNPSLVATAWVGFDSTDPLGRRETGGRAALPAWIDFMRVALDGAEEQPLPQPPGLVTLRIDPATGEAVDSGFDGAIFETFRTEYAPRLKPRGEGTGGEAAHPGASGGPTELF